MLSFSTCWNSHRHTDGEVMLAEIRNLGFESIEINASIKLSLLPGIRRLYKRGKIKIVSMHNFCPEPIEILSKPEAYEFSAPRKADRMRAIQLTQQTIDYAKEFDAEFVIVNLGSTSMSGFTDGLVKQVEARKLHGRNYVKAKLAGVQEREKIGAKHLDIALDSLDQVLTYAARRGIKIGLQSHRDYEGLPSEREMLELMRSFEDNPYVGYWHDFGHLQRKENLGLVDHVQWLEKMQPYMIGCHLHDVQWPDLDHHVPLTGMIEFDRLMPLVPHDIPVVWELQAGRRKADIKQALPAWEQRFGLSKKR